MQILKNRFNFLPIFWSIITVLMVVLIAADFRPSSAADTMSFTYQINRSAVPALNENDLTLIINVSDATSITIKDESGSILNYKSGPSSDEITVTTSRNELIVELTGATEAGNLGQFRKAGLKDNYAWAYSHGFDDNYFLEEETAVFLDRGIPAGFNLVTRWIIDPENGWAGDFQASELNTLIAAGWAINNHATDHEDSCHKSYTPETRKEDVLLAQNDLRDLIGASSKPDMLVLGYTIPCGGFEQFRDYPSIIQDIRENNEDTLLYTDGVFTFPLNMDVSAPFEIDIIRRDSRIDGSGGNAPVIIGEMNTTSQLAAESGNPYWYTTFSHGDHLFGDNTAALATVLDFLIGTYGENGADEVWIAPTSVVYSYLVVRDNTFVTKIDTPEETATPTASPTSTQTATPTAIDPTKTPNPTSTQTLVPTTLPTVTKTPTNSPFPIVTSTPADSVYSNHLFLPFAIKQN